MFHARMGRAALGLSPLALGLAWADWAAHLAISPGKQAELAWKFARKWQRLTAATSGGDGAGAIAPLKQDRRFLDPAWQAQPFAAWSQGFLLAQQWWHNATTDVPGVERRHERLVEFYARQWLDMVAPSNFPLTNPQVLARTQADPGRT
ncbi:poly-beta-hydroxybutyrate polymerase N-terminal domain-containing protein [Gemmobacter lanyuensis]